MPIPKTQRCDALILGAGCAGTRLAAHLQTLGYAGQIVLLDARSDFQSAGRWCGWNAPGLPALAPDLTALVTHQWKQWQARDANQIARCGDGQTRYYQIDAPQFHAHFQAKWRDPSSQVSLHLNQRAVSIEEDLSGVTVQTASGQSFRAPIVFDARHGGSAALEKLNAPGQLHLHQDFVGWIVESARPVFEPDCATLMDFRLGANKMARADTPKKIHSESGVRFAYVLPFLETRALVESTHFGLKSLSPAAHESALRNYLREQLGCDNYRIIARERGDLPMASAPLPERLSARAWAIGVAGGAARASSGYAFARIETQTARLARALVRGDLLDGGGAMRGRERRARRKSAWLDGAFLEVMAREPELAQHCFVRLFERVPPANLARFLGESSSGADDISIIAALPKLPFCGAARRFHLRRGAEAGRASHCESASSASNIGFDQCEASPASALCRR